MPLLRIVATFILIYLAFRVFTLYILPYLVRWYLGRVKRKFYEQNPHLRPDDEPAQGKGPHVSYKKSSDSSKSLDQIGEYVDFEDLEEKPQNDDKP